MAADGCGQLLVHYGIGDADDFPIVCDAWHPLEDELTPLWFGNDIDQEATQIGPGDWVVNMPAWAPTRHQISMWFMGHVNRDGDPFDNPMEGLESNLADWHNSILQPTRTERNATLILPSGLERSGVMSRLRLTGGGSRRPSGWPLTFEFTLQNAPFEAAGS